MPKLVIDNREVTVDDGCTILDAAEKLGIAIPSMCFLKGCKASTSCMVCVVKVAGIGSLVPSCGTVAKDGMQVETASEEVIEARKVALELLLSDHLGDCVAPCQVICPAHMNIPLMIRQIRDGKFKEAIATVKRDIALPGVLGWICPAPCEKGCRRAKVDDAVSICILKRFSAQMDIASEEPYLPEVASKKDKSVAIIGAGPTGLAAAYYLLQKGYSCSIYDKNDKLGGALRYSDCAKEFPSEVLDAEIDVIQKLGLKFYGGTEMGSLMSLEDLRQKYDAVFVAVGKIDSDSDKYMTLETAGRGIKIDKAYQTNVAGVFAGGDAVRKRKLAVRSVADGKEAAVAIDQFLSGEPVVGVVSEFNTRIGPIKDDEIQAFMLEASKEGRVNLSEKAEAFTAEQAKAEAVRCLHCDCRKADSCKLREYSQQYQANPNRYKEQRRSFEQIVGHPEIIYEPGKCIRCGLCVQIAEREKEKLGLAFVGRGFNVKVTVPFNKSIAEGLQKAAQKCVEACPTAALSMKD